MEHETRKKESITISLNKLTFWGTLITIALLVFVSFQVSSINSKLDSGTVIADEGTDEVAGQGTKGEPAAAKPVEAKPSEPKPAAPSPSLDMAELIDDDAVKGDPNAPVTIVEFSDYECPFCKRFYDQTSAQIVTDYVNTGKVKMVFRDFPLGFHAQAQKAGEAAECAGEQDSYWEMHDKLFEDGVAGGVTSFKQYAVDLGLDAAAFDECLDSDSMAAEVKADLAAGQAAGVSGTPAFVINGKLVVGAQPFSAFQAAIDEALAE